MHFVASLLPEVVHEEHRATATLHNSTAGRLEFATTWHRVIERGRLHAQPWRSGVTFEGAMAELVGLRVGDILRNVQAVDEGARSRRTRSRAR